MQWRTPSWQYSIFRRTWGPVTSRVHARRARDPTRYGHAGGRVGFSGGHTLVRRAVKEPTAANLPAGRCSPLYSQHKHCRDQFDDSQHRLCHHLGFAKEMVWNPRCRMYELRRATISKFSAKQRLGRAGRTADGECFRMYTQETFRDDFKATTVPAIRANRLESGLLTLLATGNRDILGLDFLDCPDSEAAVGSVILELSDL